MNCPRDNIPLIQRRLDEHNFHFCERCHGLWFTADGLKKILSAKDRPIIVKPGEEPWVSHSECEEPGLCPVDGKTPMVLDTRRGVCVDVCHEHRGIWLDRGELEKMVEGLVKTSASGMPAHSIAGELVGDLVFHVGIDILVEAAPIAVEAGAEVISGAAEVVGSIILEILGGLFG